MYGLNIHNLNRLIWKEDEQKLMAQNSYFVTNRLYNLLEVNGKWLNHQIELGCSTVAITSP